MPFRRRPVSAGDASGGGSRRKPRRPLLQTPGGGPNRKGGRHVRGVSKNRRENPQRLGAANVSALAARPRPAGTERGTGGAPPSLGWRRGRSWGGGGRARHRSNVAECHDRSKPNRRSHRWTGYAAALLWSQVAPRGWG